MNVQELKSILKTYEDGAEVRVVTRFKDGWIAYYDVIKCDLIEDEIGDVRLFIDLSHIDLDQ